MSFMEVREPFKRFAHLRFLLQSRKMDISMKI